MRGIEIVNYDDESKNYYFRNKFFLCPEALYKIQKILLGFFVKPKNMANLDLSICNHLVWVGIKDRRKKFCELRRELSYAMVMLRES